MSAITYHLSRPGIEPGTVEYYTVVRHFGNSRLRRVANGQAWEYDLAEATTFEGGLTVRQHYEPLRRTFSSPLAGTGTLEVRL